MKELYHLSASSHDEIMFRSEEDYYRAINYMAISLHRTDSSLLSYAIMSTHFHIALETSSPRKFIQSFRSIYNKYFNRKYSRESSLGEGNCFADQIKGTHHILAALSYINRNGLHHGITSTPFEYPFCSANLFFPKERGIINNYQLAKDKKEKCQHIPSRVTIPDNYLINSSGLIILNNIIEKSQVENMYVSPRAYLYYMNRLSSEQWENEQKKDEIDTEIINLESIEIATKSSLSEMLANEKGKINYSKTSDIELCSIIDNYFVPLYKKKSYYHLGDKQKCSIAQILKAKYYASAKQIQRSLLLK